MRVSSIRLEETVSSLRGLQKGWDRLIHYQNTSSMIVIALQLIFQIKQDNNQTKILIMVDKIRILSFFHSTGRN